MQRISLFLIAISLIAIGACSVKEELEGLDPVPAVAESVELVFDAYIGDDAPTKTAVQSDGKSVWWNAQEEINVFFGNSGSSKFTSTNAAPAARAQFTGTITGFSADIEGDGSADSFWAVYPYDAGNTCDGTSITATLPANQIACAGTFADNQWMTLAKSPGLSLAFYAVCSGFRFSVTKAGVTSVTFRGNNNEVLAGKARIGMDANDRPVVLENITEEKTVTLSAPKGESFQVGTMYYMTFYPNNFTQGFSVTFNTATETGTRVYGAKAFNRCDIHSGTNFDNSVTYAIIQEAVDLGLSVQWANVNVGAIRESDPGDIYAWGATETMYSSLSPLTWKSGKENGYDWSTYPYCHGTENTLTKYCPYSYSGYNGYTDTKRFLETVDDVAAQEWGSSWRMPTSYEWEELVSTKDDTANYTWAWQTDYNGSGRYGWLITQNSTGNHIFLPTSLTAMGTSIYQQTYWCYYRCSGPEAVVAQFGLTTSGGSSSVYYEGTSPIQFEHSCLFGDRCDGLPVRPVYGAFVPVTGISLSPSSVQLTEGDTMALPTCTISPANATVKEVYFSSSDNNIVRVSGDVVHAYAPGTATINATTVDRGYIASCTVTVVAGTAVPEAVDLGLSVKWASCNVGTTLPEKPGNKYAWGETTTKNSFSWSTYSFNPSGNGTTFTKYTGYDYSVLQTADDVAAQEWGGTWRMPTSTELAELVGTYNNTANYTWEYKYDYKHSGNSGILITQKSTGNHIFLPSVVSDQNRCDVNYWSSSLSPSSASNAYALTSYFFVSSAYFDYYEDRVLSDWPGFNAINTSYTDRYRGYLVRPVKQ